MRIRSITQTRAGVDDQRMGKRRRVALGADSALQYGDAMNLDSDANTPLVAFLDANIVLEGRPVDELPWEDLAHQGTINVLIVPKAMEEIDAKKRDGRLGPYARSFNRLIAPAVIDGNPVILRESGPRVELALASCDPIPWDDYDELDPDDGDSRIVAEALNARDVDPSNCVLVSHDIKPLAYARGRGVLVHKASDAWLRPIEPSPQDKQIQRLKQQVAEYKRSEPTIAVSTDIAKGKPATIYKVRPLDDEQVQALIETISAASPRQSQRHNPLSIGLMDYDSEYDGRYDRYIEETVPRFAAAFHKKLELLFNQHLIDIRVKNVGQIRADHLVASIAINEGWLNERVVAVSPSGPPAPRPRPSWERLAHIPNMHDFMTSRVGRHEFEMTSRARRSSFVEAACEDFRAGQEYQFSGVIMPTPDPAPLELTIGLTAANLRGEYVKSFTLEKTVAEVPVEALVDIGSLTFVEEFPVRPEIQRLIEIEQHDQIEWDGGGEDDR